MSMVVQHNLTAMNSNRMLGTTSSAQAKSTEKLSSGYKINRAADDASGLAISEKMRKQIRGLTQASANAQDGISTVQTAEGALTEVHDMLQRMNELAVKAANGTNSLSDRAAIQKEVDQLVTEIDRVAETTKFNETYLLKGDKTAVKGYTYAYAEVTLGAVKSSKVGIPGGQFTASVRNSNGHANRLNVDMATGLTATISFASKYDVGISKSTNKVVTASVSARAQNEIANSILKQGLNITMEVTQDTTNTAAIGDKKIKFNVSLNGAVSDKYTVAMVSTSSTAGKNGQVFEIRDASGIKIATVTAQVAKTSSTLTGTDTDFYTIAQLTSAGIGNGEKTVGVYSANLVAASVSAAYTVGETYSFFDKDGNGIAANDLDKYFSAKLDVTTGTVSVFARADASAVYDAVGNIVDIKSMAARVTAVQDKIGKLQVGIHVGADATSNNQITMNLEAMTAKNLGIVGLRVDGDNDTNALNAINVIKAAIQKVSDQRSDLGAVQNRLEHTIKNLDNVVENTTSAESEIRDTDMASEMVTYSKNQILSQAGQSMLAQANQSNQGVLSLLG